MKSRLLLEMGGLPIDQKVVFVMNFDIPHELQMIQRTVESYVKKELRPLEKQIEDDDHIDKELDLSLRQKAVALGLYGHNLPESLGGAGVSTLGQALIGEELGRTTMALASTVGYLPGSLRLTQDTQREWFLDPILRAEKIVAYAVTEPDAGSDFGRVSTNAKQVNGRWCLNGTKQFISNAESADFILVVAVTDPSAPLRSRFTMFIVDTSAPGYSYVKTFKKMGWRGHPLGVFTLEDCWVGDHQVLGEVGGGFAAVMSTINATRVHLTGRYLGMTHELLSLAIDYAQQRVTSGVPLSQHQSLQFMLADSEVEKNAARLLMFMAAHEADAGNPHARISAAQCKLYGSEMVGRVADRVVQIFGGAGYVSDLPIERMYRDARAFRIGEGTSEILRIQIARDLLA